ncbi:hypothetical protein ACFLV4_03450 [Chloroflexota bacterium]
MKELEDYKGEFFPQIRLEDFSKGVLVDLIKVAGLSSWGPRQVKKRGMKLLDFMAQRWDFTFQNDAKKEKLLFLK